MVYIIIYAFNSQLSTYIVGQSASKFVVTLLLRLSGQIFCIILYNFFGQCVMQSAVKCRRAVWCTARNINPSAGYKHRRDRVDGARAGYARRVGRTELPAVSCFCF